MVKKALIEHANVMATEDPPLEGKLWEEAPFRKYYEWAKRWAAASPGRPSENPTVNFSASAAESVARAQGGQRRELRAFAQPDFDAIRATLFELSPDFADIPVPGSDEDYVGLYSEADDLQVITDAAIRECRAEMRRTIANWQPGGAVMNVRASALPELGSKARVVTAAPAHWVVVGDACRKAVWPLVEAEPRIDLSGRHGIDDVANHSADAVSRAIVGAEGATYYSADLTAATDYMPFGLSEVIWRGVMDGLGVGEDELLQTGGLSLLGPVAVAYPDLTVEDVPIAHQRGFDGTADSELAIRRRDHPVVVSRRGCMMGLPLSWFCLNLYNLAMADLSVDMSVDPSTRVPEPLLGAAPAICRGDDLAAAFRPAEILRYETLVLESGCRANVPKSFRSGDSFVLAERTFVAEAAPDTSQGVVVRGGW